MEKLSCESRVKWRSTSSSPNSGKPSMSSRKNALGIEASTLAAGAGHWNALRPGEPLSKRSRGAGARDWRLSCKGSDKRFNLLGLGHFGDTDQPAIAELR